MNKVKLVLLGILAVYAAGAIASASASAAVGYWDCINVGKGNGQWKDSRCTMLGGEKEYSTKAITSEAIEGTSGLSRLAGKPFGVTTVIECKKDRATGTLEAGGASKGEVTFTGCTVNAGGEALKECKVKEPIEFKFTDQLIINSKGEIEDEFKATKAEETFVEITIEQVEGQPTCKLAVSNAKIKGHQTCEAPHGQEPLVTHELVCKPTGSVLEFGGKSAEFTSTEFLNIASALPWGNS